MKRHSYIFGIVAASLLGVAVCAAQSPQRFGLGKPAAKELISAWDIAVTPDGKGLPPGKGTAAEGAAIYSSKCASCHGPNGEGGSAEALVGGEPKAYMPFGPVYDKQRGDKKDVPFTIGNYWPYATTIFDYTRRAMPFNKPGTMTADEIYGVVAWILVKNSIIPADAVMDAKTLPVVMMPARNRFVRDDRTGGPRVKD